MTIMKGGEPLRIAYIEDTSEDADAFVKSWQELIPRITNKLDVYTTGRAYLNQLAAPFPCSHDLILLDLHLPDIDGIKMGRILKEQPELKRRSILVVVASDKDAAQAAQRLIGAEGWAEKPIRAAGILHEIGKLGQDSPRFGIEIVRLGEDHE